MKKLIFDLNPIDLILFDLDGTLVDSVPDLAAAIDAMLVDQDLPEAGEDNVRHWVGNGAEKLVERALSWALNEAVHTYHPQFPSAYQGFLAHYERTNGSVSKLYEGVYSLLQHCQALSKAMAVVTNKPLAFTHQLLKKLEIADYFHDVVGGDSFPNKKPHPEQLITLVDKHNALTPLMIGDSRHDVQAARAAGIPVIAVSYGYNHGEDIHLSEPDLVVDSLASLL